MWGSRVQFDFPVAKLLDYNARWDELEASSNPFAVVIMAHLKTQQTRGNEQHRYVWKTRLTRMLFERGYSREEIINLYKFIDWLMRLPQELEQSYWHEVRDYEEEKRMPYISTPERIKLADILTRGLVTLLNARFGAQENDIVPRLNHLYLEDLEELITRAVDAPSLEDFFKQIPSPS